MTAVTSLCLALAVACVAIAWVAAVAAAGARRAEAALRSSADAGGWLTSTSTSVATHSASDEETRHAKILEDVGRTADDLAHDLNDLLTAITGRTELLIASLDETHPGRSDAFEIRSLALSAARLSRPLRALSGSHPTTEVIDVNLVTSRTTDAFKEMLGSDIDVSLALDADVMRVRMGVGQVEEILLTLAMRARASMPRGGRLTVSTARHTRHDGATNLGPAREYARIVFADTGEAMSDDDRTALVETSLVPPGTDGAVFGFANVLSIVQQAGGRIAVESVPGLGTNVVVDLPSDSAATALQIAEPPHAIVASVLVVEDEPRVRELIRTVLARDGHDVVAVAGPHDGLAALKRQPGTELLLVDVVMPDMNGYDFAIQARTIAPGLRVIFMSGFARDVARHPPEDRFLAKPFAIESLQQVVQEALS